MSDGEWFLILCIVCAAAFYFGGVFGAYKQGKMYREKLNNCQNAIRKELSGVTSRYILEKQGNYHGYYDGVYRGLTYCLYWLERI
jgi:hypothetical protein